MPAVALYDSTRPALIPASAPAVAGYINGDYAWTAQDWARFPTAYRKTISVVANQPAMILDVEKYDASPDQAPGWVTLAHRAGVTRPTCYCSRLGTWPATQAAIDKAGLADITDYWIADYTGSPHLVFGSQATQWTDAGPYDLSVADLAWLGGTPVISLNAPCVKMLATPTGQGYWIFGADGGVFTKGDAVFYGSLGGKPVAGKVVDAVPTPSGKGYWMVTDAGAVYTFGDAQYYGNAP